MTTDQNIANFEAEEVYSVVFLPSESIKTFVREMKKYLKFTTGTHFGSENSEAHISICEFLATPHTLKMAEKHIEHFCRYFKPFNAKFDATDFFTHKNNYTYYLAPDKESRTLFEHVMKKINTNFPASKIQKVTNPHLTIGRKLNDCQLHTAQQKWGNTQFDVQLSCDKIALRKFNSQIGQFSVVNSYYFLAEEEWMLF